MAAAAACSPCVLKESKNTVTASFVNDEWGRAVYGQNIPCLLNKNPCYSKELCVCLLAVELKLHRS